MKVCDIILFFENIDPNVDLDKIHETFVNNNMDVLIALGKIDEGQIVLDVSAYETDTDSASMKAIHLSEELLGEGKLVKVTASNSEMPTEHKDD